MNRPNALWLALVLVLSSMSPLAAQRGKPYRAMDYGPFLTATVEVAPGNIAQKGICVRVDVGAGGVAEGKAFLCFETDTLRWAAGWAGAGFIDWRGIIFNGNHNAHPKIVGARTFANPTAPGWGKPEDGSFDDPRLRGLDGKAYGPLPHAWGHWKGLLRRGDQVVLSYDVGERRVLEVPGFAGGDAQVFTRSLELAPFDGARVLQVVSESTDASWLLDRSTLGAARAGAAAQDVIALLPVEAARAAVGDQIDLGASDFTITAWIKTTADTGTILSKAAVDGPWVAKGKTFFVRSGRLGYDVGWVGAVQGKVRVADGKWHHVAVTHRAGNGRTRLWVDGKPDGDGELPSPDGDGHIVRLGYTATSFMPAFNGTLDEVRVYRRMLKRKALGALAANRSIQAKPEASWEFNEGKGKTAANAAGADYPANLRGARWGEGRRGRGLVFDGKSQVRIGDRARARAVRRDPVLDQDVVAAMVVGGGPGVRWVVDDGNLRLRFPSSATPRRARILHWRGPRRDVKRLVDAAAASGPPMDVGELVLSENPKRDQATITTKVRKSQASGPLAVDELTLPTENPWRSWIRLGGFDFFDDPDRAAVCSWQGDVWTVSGLASIDESDAELKWRRIASGLFQPLGLKIKDGKIYVLGRDQITHLVDHNGDGETDWYENFNNDAQVTEHFHEFAMDLQTDAAGNFYYMKGARHAKVAVVPHHGTLIKVSADGKESEVLASGFRAPNGLAVNADGTFLSSDQEGHWTPMNRINWIRPGGFYGNMMGYCPDRKDTSYDPPLCWIHKNTDRSPAAQLWVTSDRWRTLKGAMLSLSYGTGRIWNVLHEKVGDVVQGGVVQLPLEEFPTGIQRGRFHAGDGQLYACGLFGWSSNKTRPGGFYRIRRTSVPLDVPTSLHAVPSGVVVGFSNPLDPATATDPRRYRVERWNYKRTRNYGSRDYKLSDGERGRDRVPVLGVQLSKDGRSVLLQMPDMGPCMQMEINYKVRSAAGKDVAQKVHHTIHAIGDGAVLNRLGFDPSAAAPLVVKTANPAPDAGLELTLRTAGRPESIVDRRVARLAALRVEAGEAASPFLDPGPFVAEWAGHLDVDLPGTYRFHADVAGGVVVTVNGEEVLRGRGGSSTPTSIDGRSIELLSGLSAIRVRFRSQETGTGSIRVLWSGRGFPREPLPSRLLRHAPTPPLAAMLRRDTGRTMFATRSCARCHAHQLAEASLRMPELSHDEPSLVGVGSRFDRTWLFEWMRNPRGLQRHATMPALLPADDPAARRDAADIATWLATLTTPAPPMVPDPPRSSRERGRRLFEDLGCVACHTFDDPGKEDPHARHSLYHSDAKFRPGALRAYLKAPREHHAWSRMPDFGLDPSEVASLALHVRAAARGTLSEAAELKSADARRGEAAFKTRGCASCHLTSKDPEGRASPGLRLQFGRASTAGCIADAPRRGVPDFGFSADERGSLRAFLATDGRSLQRVAPAAAAERAVAAARCTSCHDRDGVLAPRLGILLEHGRKDGAPEALPSLTHAGEKLRVDYLQQLLGGTAGRARPWMRARMPAFPARAPWLARGLASGHGVSASARPRPDAALAAHGKRLTATEGGFSCVQCHGVGARDAFGPFGDRGVNFTEVAGRLRYEFYRRWMFAPLRVDPRTKMPAFAPDGATTVVKDVLGGHAGRQFDALWHYLATSPKSSRPLVRRWTVAELVPRLDQLNRGRSFETGRTLFGEMSCIKCHQVKGEGGKIGPDLTKIGDKHQPLALLAELLEPSRVIDPKYQHHVVFTKDDDIVTGLLVSEDRRSLKLVENALDPDDVVTVLKKDIAERRLSDISPMPTGLVDTLREQEILDLLAYIRSGGDPGHDCFKERK